MPSARVTIRLTRSRPKPIQRPLIRLRRNTALGSDQTLPNVQLCPAKGELPDTADEASPPKRGFQEVGGTGLEPVTPSLSSMFWASTEVAAIGQTAWNLLNPPLSCAL